MTSAKNSSYEGFTAEERAAMKEHAQEQKKAARDVLAKIAEMPDPFRPAFSAHVLSPR